MPSRPFVLDGRLQETTAWAIDRAQRAESVVEHALHIVEQASLLLARELEDIRKIRADHGL